MKRSFISSVSEHLGELPIYYAYGKDLRILCELWTSNQMASIWKFYSKYWSYIRVNRVSGNVWNWYKKSVEVNGYENSEGIIDCGIVQSKTTDKRFIKR